MDRRDSEKKRALSAFLVASARVGDRRAAGQLTLLHGDRIAAHAVRLLGDRDGARDIVQEAWVEILRGLPRLRDDHAFLPWALRITTRRVARDIRRRQAGRALASAYAAETDPTVPEDGPGASDAAKVRRAIARLPADQAATIALFYLDDLTVAEVATALDVPVGTVKTRLMHARRKLRDLLKGEDDEQT
ncbi:RNA polymerase sigma factor [Maritimibacter sp. DP1N21-5]|uniref:RNA polymerase sigma factor n=1 Tax=Maritimibacter sp. DP1N21-5 TaxID=2836867 RepID=UPI001C46BC1B|nr:RNA polymerase sigma factor [Maritimibacter sp. DP1N21-5]MBV7410530.1 RNA polymerase sigma factor [Maritimibacter sp. DP1N21-5]